MITTEKFIDSLTTGEVEFNNLKIKLTLTQAIANKTENIYFLTGIKNGINKRASDEDIESKKYFCIDLDIRKAFKGKITNEEIKAEGISMSENLRNDNELLGLWRYIVFSGNGLHVYYTFEEQSFGIENYAMGVEAIYEQWDMFWNNEIFNSDMACKNIARILRLPGSINQKNGAEVKIIAVQDTDCKFDIKKMGEDRLKYIKEKNILEQQKRLDDIDVRMKMDKLINGRKYIDKKAEMEAFFKKLDNIPAYIVSEKLLPQFKLHKNGRNFLSDSKKGNNYTGFFYSKGLNAIVNGGSSYYNFGTTNSGYSSTVLVKNELGLGWKETVSWFRDNFKNI